jgi:hypothetical protein
VLELSFFCFVPLASSAFHESKQGKKKEVVLLPYFIV